MNARFRIVGIVSIVYVLFGAVLHAEAMMSSAQYSMTSYGVGQAQGSTMSSSQYSLTTTQSQSPVNLSTVVVSTDSDDAAETATKIVQAGGRKKLTIENISHVLAVSPTLAFNESDASSERVESRQEVHGVGNDVSIDTTEQAKNVHSVSSMTASAMQAYLAGQFNSIIKSFNETFDTRAARALLFGCVLGALYFLRSNTAFGRKYRPF